MEGSSFVIRCSWTEYNVSTEKIRVMTGEEIQSLLASIAVKNAEIIEIQEETARQMQETDRRMKETGQQMQETDRRMKETDRQLRELKQQIGGLGEKFGSFTEGLALPSMTKILMQRFGMTFVAPRVRIRKDGRSIELDVLAYSNSGVNEVYIVEVKSHLREEGLDQMRRTLADFREFFPEHAGKKVYGIIATVDTSDPVREKALREGFYLARIHDGQFELEVPSDFQPRAY